MSQRLRELEKGVFRRERGRTGKVSEGQSYETKHPGAALDSAMMLKIVPGGTQDQEKDDHQPPSSSSTPQE